MVVDVRIAAYALAAWTLFTWGTRIRNAAQDDEQALAFVIPVALVAIAVAAVARPRRWGRLLALAASLAWLVRVPIILAGDHGVGFKVVHTMLAVITWALAAWTLRSAPALHQSA
jgi:hypothetical protein